MPLKILLLLIASAIALSPVHATTIAVDLGPPMKVVGEKSVTFNSLDNIKLSGQTLSFDIVFPEGSFVRLPVLKKTGVTATGFSLQVMLSVSGAGTVNNSAGKGYVFDSAQKQIGEVQTFDGGSVTTDAAGESARIMLGHVSPLLDKPGMAAPLDIYGAHFEVTLPDAPRFRVTGGELLLSANGSRQANRFEIVNGLAEKGRRPKPGARQKPPKQ
ncbi:MAG: hypothetical protein H0X73_04075 [Chthoniobacterales bacterium]|nr:hypothetical protein [Chthoniobacterales bacterium]